MRVLNDLDLQVPEGSLFGFLGPNGAGKTTTIRILLGLLRATAGQATVLAQDAWRAGPLLRRDTGYLPGDLRLYPQLTGRQTLDILNAARGHRSTESIRRLAERFDLDLAKRVRDYSRGMKQKLGLMQAMMHRPKLLILDEPTIALDPLVREWLFGELRDIAKQGNTVLFSSHTLSEVDELCDWVAIVRHGKLIEQAATSSLRARSVRRVEVTFPPGAPPPKSLPNGLIVNHQSDHRLVGSHRGDVGALLDWIQKCQVIDVSIEKPGLEDLFMTYYADDGLANASAKASEDAL
ncbi:MAG: ABC transporter ATP-binding protein [Phycisphaerae bacterium]